MGVYTVKTFPPSVNSRGGDAEFEGTYRKGELRGIIQINQDDCVGCDTCSKFCPTDAIDGSLGVAHKIDQNLCVACGQCLINCPFGVIEQMSFVDEVIKKLEDKKTFVVAHPAPSVRVALAEEFGGEPGDLTINKMYNALEKAGFNMYDVNFAADHTILEEGTELIKKIKYWVLGERSDDLNHMAEHPFPHFTSCCPAWVRNAEIFHPELIPHISGAKSPIQMGGPLAKTWAAKFVWNKDPRDIFMVSITPCTAKIFEASRPEFDSAYRYLKQTGEIPEDTASFPDIDAVLTARDLANLFRKKGINPLEMSAEYPEKIMNVYSGGGTIFGNSGGVMEAALRTAYYLLSGQNLKDPELTPVRGYDKDLTQAVVPIPLKDYDGKILELKIAVVNGASRNLNTIIKHITKESNKYHFIEVMNCPGGCVNGGGQPVQAMGTSWLHPLLPLPLRA
ncbi:[Fe-Fe] hydrogenase large subunit C-terminal domain-containing protein [Campylobacter pinnipediorum]|uniref:[Fe-Fe] hydrogenase large subunit C-terminal domain-containing protein n=1 Tax=Campylobacter pinnipediorum TaxID=1965231 RepID=UPI00084DFDF5|nr:[Fe-Fe] hydrogenase large subunit C-terminal domain-containing protein [Campylobacter pinnipediorum]AQW80831.1 [FeFe] hydrogenase, large subunit [Campylobacter pinnipediorum subsp. pinnipediorum]OPA74493.1 iron hydrogenase [Campylobacter pinnipediorum subsp. pinnipediorum]